VVFTVAASAARRRLWYFRATFFSARYAFPFGSLSELVCRNMLVARPKVAVASSLVRISMALLIPASSSVRSRERSAQASAFALHCSLASSKKASSSSSCFWVEAFSSSLSARFLEVSPRLVCLFSRVVFSVASSEDLVAMSSS